MLWYFHTHNIDKFKKGKNRKFDAYSVCYLAYPFVMLQFQCFSEQKLLLKKQIDVVCLGDLRSFIPNLFGKHFVYYLSFVLNEAKKENDTVKLDKEEILLIKGF